MSEDERVTGELSMGSALRKVRKLVAMAEDPACDPNEAQKMRDRADAMMLAYAIRDAVENASRPAEEKTKPITSVVEVGGHDSDILEYIGGLANMLARHCRCKVRVYSKYDYEAKAWQAKVYGFESDVRYFEFLYTTLRLHMLGVLIPRMDPKLSMQENCYRLHEAGYNWLEMAAMDGWRKYPGQQGVAGHLIMYYNQALGQDLPAGQLGGQYKRPYYAACKAKGERPVKIAAGSTLSYRKSAANGYTSRLSQRLMQARQAAERESTGSELVLRSRFDDIEAMFRQDNPELYVKADPAKSVKMKMPRGPRFNAAGYDVGVKHANSADLNAGMSASQRREIG